jgi:hypothetical protein
MSDPTVVLVHGAFADASTDSIDGSHTAFIADPVRVAAFIQKALAG